MYSQFEEGGDSKLIEEMNNFYDKKEPNNLINTINIKRNIKRNFMDNFYYYTLTFYSGSQIIFNIKDKDIFKEQIKSIISPNVNKIFISNCSKKFYINEIIKSPNFNSFIKLRELKDVEEIKKMQSIIKCMNLDIIDYRGNSLYFNTSLNKKRGTEDYYPPYNWIALGINVDKYGDDDWIRNKTESSKWATGYHPIPSIEIMNKILKEGLKPGESQDKENHINKRNINEKVGRGVYIYQNIEMAEQKAIKILIDGKKYKLVFMVKVLIEKIKEPIDINYWILDPNYLRIYRVLIK